MYKLYRLLGAERDARAVMNDKPGQAIFEDTTQELS
jgi:hypothetical protein